jgi:hypothetical protein
VRNPLDKHPAHHIAASGGGSTEAIGGLTRPSEIAAAVAVPVGLINDVMSIPGSIFKFRLDYSKAEADLATQEAARIKAQSDQAVALVTAQTSLQTAQTTLETTQLNDATARYKAILALIQAQNALNTALAATRPPPAASLAAP